MVRGPGVDQQGAVKCFSECGLRTTRPYIIDGRPYCPDCAHRLDPGMVREQVMRDFTEWSGATWKSRSGGPGNNELRGD